jgi:hypothetical protein
MKPKIRYFMATDGKVVIFRASKTMNYRSADMILKTFTQRHRSGDMAGILPVREITADQHLRLVALKKARLKNEGKNWRVYNAPSDSWVTYDAYITMNMVLESLAKRRAA